MNAQEIRQAYLDFFKERGHKLIPRANLVPQDDPTTLFTGSGMQPLLPYLLGEKHPKGARLVNSQICLRAEDIEEIGDNRHTTFFEMLGNWSLGDYFKEEQLSWFFEFLTENIKLDPERMYVSVFIGDKEKGIPKDEASVEIWQRLFEGKDVEAKSIELASSEAGSSVGMQSGRIFYYDAKENWWSRVGDPEDMPTGEPGGPDSEVFYEFPQVEHDDNYGKYCHPACDCGRFIEIGNSVFMQYVRNSTGGFDELPQKSVDFGGGLERIAAAAIDNPDVFQISLLKPIIDGLEVVSSKKYVDNPEAMRVIADHLRASVFLALDGVTPSNKEQGYVMRRLMRRAIRHAFDLDIAQDLVELSVPLITEAYQDDFADLAERQQGILNVMKKEESLFRQTLTKGEKKFTTIIDDIFKEKGELTGTQVFELYDTYGYPSELTIEQAVKKGVNIAQNWQEEFEQELQQQRERSRTASKGQFKGGLGGEGDMHRKYHTATHLMYRALREVLGEHVVQHGSNITDERLRFDFAHPQKMTEEEKQQVEDIVNDRIKKDLLVTWEELPTDEAFERGAYGAFGDTYGDTVKVYSMKDEDGNVYSYEICGGPHAERTSELASEDKQFKIKKEESSSAGVRRIKAVLE